MAKGDRMTDEQTRRERIELLLKGVFRRMHDETEPGFQEKQSDFVFHMLDAEQDLFAFVAFLSAPDSYTAERAHAIVTGFLDHAPAHFVAAARLYDEFLDTFANSR